MWDYLIMCLVESIDICNIIRMFIFQTQAKYRGGYTSFPLLMNLFDGKCRES